jgi:hypothetical protein
MFGDCDPRTVRFNDISAWRKYIEDDVSLREAHRALKIWRALWKVAAALGYRVRDADPSLGVRSSAAPGRSAKTGKPVSGLLSARSLRLLAPTLRSSGLESWNGQKNDLEVIDLWRERRGFEPATSSVTVRRRLCARQVWLIIAIDVNRSVLLWIPPEIVVMTDAFCCSDRR